MSAIRGLGLRETAMVQGVERSISEFGLARHIAKEGHGWPYFLPSFFLFNKLFPECLLNARHSGSSSLTFLFFILF